MSVPTTITGGDHSYTAAELVSATGTIIVRSGTLPGTVDDFDLIATSLGTALGLPLDDQYIGYTFSVIIQNNSANTIQQNCTGTDLTESWTGNLYIPPYGSRKFQFILSAGTVPAFFVDDVDNRKVFGPLTLPVTTDAIVPTFGNTTGDLLAPSGVTISTTDVVSGVTLLNLLSASTFNVGIEPPATLAATWTLTLPDVAGSAGQYLTNVGAGVTEWSALPFLTAALSAYGPPAAPPPANLTNAYVTVNFTTTNVDDGGMTMLNGVVTILTAGIYEISYWAQFASVNNASSQQAALGCQILLTGSLAGVALGSTAQCFIIRPGGDVARQGCGKTILLTLAANDTFELQVARTSGSTIAQLIPDQSRITSLRIK